MVIGGRSIGYTQQHCQADIVIAPYPDEKIVKLTLSNIGKVFCTTVENDDVVTDEYQGLDSTAINLALVGNAPVLMKVDVFTYEVFSASNDNKDIHSFIARATGWQPGWQPGDYLDGPFKGASVTVTMYGFDHECDYLDHGCNDHRFYKDTDSEFVSIDSNSGDLTLPLQHETPIPNQNTLFIIEGRRDGSIISERMVAYIHRICVDGKRIKLRLSKKGLKSKGCAAKKAVAGFKEGVYKIQSMYPVVQVQPWKQIQTRNGVLKKTAEDGTFNLEFKVDSLSRVYNFDPETKTVSSIRVNYYLAQVIQGAAEGGDILAQITIDTSEKNAFLAAFVMNWSRSGLGYYTATVNLPFHDAAKLGEETFIGRFIINSAPIRVGVRGANTYGAAIV